MAVMAVIASLFISSASKNPSIWKNNNKKAADS
jgi:hypothetical protein